MHKHLKFYDDQDIDPMELPVDFTPQADESGNPLDDFAEDWHPVRTIRPNGTNE